MMHPKAGPSRDSTDLSSTNTSSALSRLEQLLLQRGLVRVQSLDPSLRIELRYGTTDNVVGRDMYGDLTEAYLQPEAARMLVEANAFLKEKHPHYTLYIYDAVRPRRVQQILWDALDHPPGERKRYIADPKEGSLHNYGAAVDLTILNTTTDTLLDMATDFDHFGVLAYPEREEALLERGDLSEEQVHNRRLLREVMTRAGFLISTSEWWHFSTMSREEAAARYEIVE
jgi:D-alanyl-D-alanine dipeptidase